MQEIFNFIKQNWEIIVSVITFIVSVVIAIIRKKPISDIDSSIYCFAIQGILLAEKGNKKGKEKLDAAVLYVSQCLSARFPNIDTGKYFNYIARVIETILTTPQKKGE